MTVRTIKVWNASASAWEGVGVEAPDFGEFVSASLVTAKGDLIAGAGSASVDNLAVGTDGQVLTADSNETLGVKWADAAGGLPTQTNEAGKFLTTNGTAASWVDPPTNRNLLINGAMQVAQRSTSVAAVSNGTYNTADRWRYATGGSTPGVWTQSVETDGPTGSGFTRSLKMLCTTADDPLGVNDQATIQYLMEGQDLQRIKKGTASAEQLTLSFWVKSNVTGTMIARLNDADNVRHVSASYTVVAADTWEYKTLTFPADTSGVLDNDNAQSMSVQYFLAAGSNLTSGTLATTWEADTTANRAVGQTNLAAATNNYWQITGVQLETGPVATPFEFEPYEATLRKCQRYYQRITPGAAGRYFGHGQSYSTTQTEITLPFKTVMRTNPTALEQNGTAADYRVGTAGGSTTALSAVPSFVHASDNAITILATVASGQVAGNAAPIMAWTTTAYLGWSAEL